MKKYSIYLLNITLFLTLLQPLILIDSSYASEIKLKLGTLGPKGTSVTLGVELIDEVFHLLDKNMGHKVTIIGYYGGIMGDDPQMIQKAQMGQLDLITPTVNGMPLCATELETFYMAYVIENYGQYDYIMTNNSTYINDIFYKNGWISLVLVNSEGQHDLYLDKPYRTPDDLKNNLKATNYTGGPDTTFYEALDIPQIPIQPTEMFLSFKAGLSNAVILPSTFVIGMQIYCALPYMVDPPIRISSSALLMTKKKWKTLPWDFRIYLASLQPIIYYYFGGLMRDGANAYSNAMYRYGSKKLKLSFSELKAIKDPVMKYRKTYLGDNKIKWEIYNRMQKRIKEYKSGNPIEKVIYESDPSYVNFPDQLKKIARAIRIYRKTGSKSSIARLAKKKVIEKWRIYDWIAACERFIKTNNSNKLKKWMSSFYVKEEVDEMFSKHIDAVKKVFGTKKALDNRLEELLVFMETDRYNGFQKMGLKQNTTRR